VTKRLYQTVPISLQKVCCSEKEAPCCLYQQHNNITNTLYHCTGRVAKLFHELIILACCHQVAPSPILLQNNLQVSGI